MQQGDEVLGGLHPAGPHERVGVTALGGLPDGGESVRLHARVDGPQPGAGGAAALLPAPGVGVAGGQEVGPGVDLGGQPQVEGGDQGPYGGAGLLALPGAQVRQVVGAQLYPVLRHQQRDPEEAFGQQTGERRHPARGRVADVDRAEALAPGVLLVPVEGQRPQHALEFVHELQQVGHVRRLYGAARARGPAGGFQGPHRGLGAQCRVEPALFAGEAGEPVQPGGKGVRRAGADPVDELLEAVGEPPALTPGVGPPVVGGGPQGRRADVGDVLGQRDPGALLLGAAAQRVELELVLRESAHEPVAPQPGLARRIRITTFREQSDPHEWHPRSPVQAVAVRSGDPPRENSSGYAEGATDGCPSRHRKG